MTTPEQFRVKHAGVAGMADSEARAKSWLRRSLVWERRLADLRDESTGTVSLAARRPVRLAGRRRSEESAA